MAEKAIRIRIGCSVDRNLTTVFPSLEKAAKQARATIEKELNAAFTGLAHNAPAAAKVAAGAVSSFERSATSSTKKVDKSFRELENWARTGGAKMMDPGARAIAAFGSEAKTHFDGLRRSFTVMANDADREFARMERSGRKAAAGLGAGPAGRQGGSRSRFDGVSTAASLGRSGMRAAASIAGGLARGAGVEMDLGTHAANNAQLETQAVKISNSAYMPGKEGAAGQRQDPAQIAREMQAVGNATATSFNVAADGLDKFVAKTGDLETGRAVMMNMARLAKATGADLNDTADAAGDVANALGDVPNKAQAVDSVMRAIAAQGKEGAVEIKDLASQMAKLSTASTQFGGGSSQNMAIMGSLVQMTRAKGGAASATQAATSVSSFVNTFSKGARLNKFEKYGVNVHENADGSGMLRGANDIILDAIKATKGNSKQMGEMFADAGARRVTRGFETIYNQAGGGTKGEEAVKQAFDELAKASMNEKEITDSLSKAMATQQSQAQLFNNQMQETTAELQAALLPAFKELGPLVVGAAKAFTSFVGLVTGATKQKENLDNYSITANAGNSASGLNDAVYGHTTTPGGARVKGTLKEGDLKKAQEDETALQAAIDKKQELVTRERQNMTNPFEDVSSDDALEKKAKGGNDTAAQQLRDRRELEAMKGEMDRLKSSESAVVDALRSGTLKVEVVNHPTPPVAPDRGPHVVTKPDGT